jgi:hypothetical protein
MDITHGRTSFPGVVGGRRVVAALALVAAVSATVVAQRTTQSQPVVRPQLAPAVVQVDRSPIRPRHHGTVKVGRSAPEPVTHHSVKWG